MPAVLATQECEHIHYRLIVSIHCDNFRANFHSTREDKFSHCSFWLGFSTHSGKPGETGSWQFFVLHEAEISSRKSSSSVVLISTNLARCIRATQFFVNIGKKTGYTSPRRGPVNITLGKILATFMYELRGTGSIPSSDA